MRQSFYSGTHIMLKTVCDITLHITCMVFLKKALPQIREAKI